MIADGIAEERSVAIPLPIHDAALGVDRLLEIVVHVEARLLFEDGTVEVAHGGVVVLQSGDVAGDSSDPPGMRVVHLGQLGVVFVGLGRMALLAGHFHVG